MAANTLGVLMLLGRLGSVVLWSAGRATADRIGRLLGSVLQRVCAASLVARQPLGRGSAPVSSPVVTCASECSCLGRVLSAVWL